MDVAPVDPRDVSWEVDRPRYRVHFWTEPADPVGMRVCDEYELSGPDVHAAEVLAWAAEQSAGRATGWYEVFVVVDAAREGRGLIRLTPPR